ncbi:stress response translation initiation inhibitor YciH [Candidatus Woesearchaeota archaeon]|nr:stress response translation initiation inhibitor YciH [Candidatus Woesearchaeota archaeon]
MEKDPITGLPKDLLAFDDIAKESQTIHVKIIKKKFGKKYTVIEGLRDSEVSLKDVAKQLKSRFACGGTAKADYIELQGDHISHIKKELVNLGFAHENINVSENKYS